LLNKLQAQVTFTKNSIQLHIPKNNAWKAQAGLLQKQEEQDLNIPEEMLHAVIPSTGISGRAKADPINVELKPDVQPVRRKQYPMKTEAKVGLEELINKFLQYGLLLKCQSECNNLIFPVKKRHSSEY